MSVKSKQGNVTPSLPSPLVARRRVTERRRGEHVTPRCTTIYSARAGAASPCGQAPLGPSAWSTSSGGRMGTCGVVPRVVGTCDLRRRRLTRAAAVASCASSNAAAARQQRLSPQASPLRPPWHTVSLG